VTSALLDAALWYAARGWRVLPLVPRAKVPLGRLAPHGCHEASTDVGVIRDWWASEPSANVGVATGVGSGVWVLDLDGQPGRDSWAGLVRQHGAAPTMGQRTGSGGAQGVYSWPSAAQLDGRELGNRAGVRPGVDVRGEGGYVVVPPSVHPCGAAYRWVRRCAPAQAPRWLLDRVAKARPEPVRRPPRLAGYQYPGGTALGRARLAGLVRTVVESPSGERNQRLNWACWQAAGHVQDGEIPLADAMAALVEAGTAAGLTSVEVERTVRSGFKEVLR